MRLAQCPRTTAVPRPTQTQVREPWRRIPVLRRPAEEKAGKGQCGEQSYFSHKTKDLISLATAIAVSAYTAITVFLWCNSTQQIAISRDAEIRQLRAYVGFTGDEIALVCTACDDPTKQSIRNRGITDDNYFATSLKNYGQTPLSTSWYIPTGKKNILAPNFQPLSPIKTARWIMSICRRPPLFEPPKKPVPAAIFSRKMMTNRNAQRIHSGHFVFVWTHRLYGRFQLASFPSNFAIAIPQTRRTRVGWLCAQSTTALLSMTANGKSNRLTFSYLSQ